MLKSVRSIIKKKTKMIINPIKKIKKKMTKNALSMMRVQGRKRKKIRRRNDFIITLF